MKKIISVILAIVVLVTMLVTVAKAQLNIPEYIRVGLFYNTTAKTVVAISGENVAVTCEGAEPVYGTDFSISITEQGFYVNYVLYQTNILEFKAENEIINIDSKPYRGYVRLISNGNSFNVINVVKLEEYLYGVLPLEMATGWPMEALKAQAVCARTYAAKDVGRFEQYGFDVTDTTLSQVYGGMKVEKEDTTRAVDETRGLIATYNGKIAETYYFATSSGTTLDVKDVWGSNNYPYLVPVDDSLQVNIMPDYGAWKVEYTKDELTELFEKKGAGIGVVLDVTVDEYNQQNAVMKLTFKGSEGTKSYTKGKTRDILNLKSQTYTLTKLTTGGEDKELNVLSVKGNSTIKLNMNVISKDGQAVVSNKLNVLSKDKIECFEKTEGDFTGIRLNGTGNGHGIGMSQNGAKAMAKEGYTFEEIIKHYYTGVELTNVAAEVTDDETMEAF